MSRIHVHGHRILLVISGGIAAYKSLELIRRLRERGASVRAVLTRGGAQFVMPLSVAALCEDKVYTDLFSLTDEAEMGHIRLARDADMVVVAPASANLLARAASGLADDLAATVLLASDRPLLLAPAMNVRMWLHPATRANLATLRARGAAAVGPVEGAMACGEHGMGRMAEPDAIVNAIDQLFATGRALSGLRALVTSGPTHEPIDAVRYIANRSSGKQGHAIARALSAHGAATTLVSGPTSLADPPGVAMVRVETAAQMFDACQAALPVDVAVCAAAVADWRTSAVQPKKMKKNGGPPPTLDLEETTDILQALAAAGNRRPRLVVGFAAETGDVVAKAQAKRKAKRCDWIVANDVSVGTQTFGGDTNDVHIIAADGVDSWPAMTKADVAERLAKRIAGAMTAEKRS